MFWLMQLQDDRQQSTDYDSEDNQIFSNKRRSSKGDSSDLYKREDRRYREQNKSKISERSNRVSMFCLLTLCFG